MVEYVETRGIDPASLDSTEAARLAGPPDAALFWFRVGNYPHILAAYGQDVADALVAAASHHLRDFVMDTGTVQPCRADILEVRIKRGKPLGDEMTPAAGARWAAGICEKIPLIPLQAEGEQVHIWLSACWSIFSPEENGDVLEWQFPFVGIVPGQGEEAQRYRSDMALSSRALTALRSMHEDLPGESGGLRPFWQKVRNAECGTTQYFEALARLSHGDGLPERPGNHILSLERTGFVRLLDLFMARQVIAELARSPEIRLGVNLSALSLSSDPWWDEIKSVLLQDQDLARRLFLEITETAALPNVSIAVRFVDTMRKLGCRVVLDDFGTGYASIRQLLAFSPDVIKIDRLFLRRAAVSVRDRNIFLSLAKLAKSTGATVVAEGVETSSQNILAIEAGVDWQQGYLWGQPCGCRPRPYSGKCPSVHRSIEQSQNAPLDAFANSEFAFGSIQ